MDFRGGVKRESGRRRKETLGGGEGCNLRGVAGKGEIVKSKWVTGWILEEESKKNIEEGEWRH